MSPRSPITEAQAETFWRDGFVLFENAVSPEQLRGMREDLRRWVEASREHAGAYGEMLDGRPRFDVEPGHGASRPALRRVASPTEISPVTLDVVMTSTATDAACALVGPDVRFHHSKLNSKLPGTATTVRWHQDFTFDPHTNDDSVTVMVFLDDVDAAGGAPRLAPGTHRGPLYSLWQDGVFTGSIADAQVDDLERIAVPVTGPAGSACLMHARVAHASAPNASERPRTLFIYNLVAADALALTPNAVPSIHAGMIVRGREPGRIRSIAFEMETPEVPEGASFFEQQSLAPR